MEGMSALAHVAPQLMRLAAPALNSHFGGDDDRNSIAGRLEKTLDALFKVFHRDASRRAEAVATALDSLSPLIDQAASLTGGRFELRITTLATDADGNATIRSLVIEASVLRLEATTPEGSLVLDVWGARVSLTEAEIENGQLTGLYSQSLSLSGFSLFATDNDRFIAAHQAIAILQETQAMLAAYRDGDLGPLEKLRQSLAEA